MARLPYLEAEPEYRDMLKRNTNLHKLLVNSPDMARAFNDVGGYIRYARVCGHRNGDWGLVKCYEIVNQGRRKSCLINGEFIL